MKKLLFTLSMLTLTIGLSAQRVDRQSITTGAERGSLTRSVATTTDQAPPRRLITAPLEERKQQLSELQKQRQDRQVYYKLTAVKNSEIPDGQLRITFSAEKIWMNGEGYQMLLDKDCSTYNTLANAETFPTSQGYGEFEHTIPTNATPNFNDGHVIVGNKASIDIEPGYYDMFIVSPSSNAVFFADGQRWHRVQFLKGFEYIFSVVASIDDGNETVISGLKHDFELINPGNRIEVFNEKTPVNVQINNLGFASHNSPLKIYYQFNGGQVQQLTPEQAPPPQESETYTLDSVDMRPHGDYTHKIWIDDPLGWTSSNDTITYTIKSVGAFPLPFKENFNQATISNTLSQWSIIDIDKDLFTWSYDKDNSSNTDKPSGCMAYSFANYYPANDLLITPLLALQSGKNTVSFKARCNFSAYPERMQVWINTKKSLEGATRIDSLMIYNEDWMSFGCEFALEQAQEMYVIFHACSDRNMYVLYLDGIEIQAGSKLDNFKSEVKIEYIKPPYTSCDLGSHSEIQLMLRNNGLATAKDLSLTCRINGVSFTDELTQVNISPNSQKLVTLKTKPDLSKLGSYSIALEGTCAQQNTPILPDSTTFKHIEPIALPIVSSFNNAPSHWSVNIKKSWAHIAAKPGLLGHWHASDNIGTLSSNCFEVTQGRSYRVNLSFSGGEKFYVTFYDNIVIYAGISGTPLESWDSVGIIKNIFTESPQYAYIHFEAKQTGHMAVAFRSQKAPRQLRIYNTSIERIEYYDASPLGYRTSIPEQIPAHFVSAGNSLGALIANQGDRNLNDVHFELYDNAIFVGRSDSSDIAPDSRAELNSLFTILNPSLGKHTLQLVTKCDPADEKNINDSLSLSYIITDTLLARDRMSDFSVGIGSHIGAINIGQLYKLPVSDTLTSIAISFPKGSQRMKFDLAIYLTYPAELQDTALKFRRLAKLIEDLERPTMSKGGFVTYHISPIILPKGDYYVEIRQKTIQTINVCYDNNMANFMYISLKDSAIYFPGAGALGLRLCFGNNPEIFNYDAQPLSIQQPAIKGMFAANEPIEATIANNGSFQINNLDVKCQVGSQIKTTSISTLAPGGSAKVHFEMDLSTVGKHTILVSTNLNNDEKISNDTLRYQVECFANQYSPYTLDFEECEDFATAGFIPGWISLDVNNVETAIFSDYSFPYMGNAFGFMAFNPYITTPPIIGKLWSPHTGKRFGACFSEAMPNNAGELRNNDWLISPKLKLGSSSQFEFFARGTGAYDENFQVWVSTSNMKLDSFVAVSPLTTVKDTTWTRFSYDLSAYDGQSVHVAIQCVTPDGFIFGVDDLKITTSSGISNEEVNLSRISIYPNPAQDFIVVYQPDLDIQRIQIYDLMGREVFSSNSVNNTHYRIHLNGFNKGMYVVRLKTLNGDLNYKFLKE